MAFLLAMALLPLGVISVVQSHAVLREAEARSEAALTGETMRASDHAVRLIQRGQGAAAALAEVVRPLLADTAACSAALREVAAGSQIYSVVGFLENDLRMNCSSLDEPIDLSDTATAQAAIKAGKPLLQVSRKGRVSGTSVVLASHPVLDDDGRQLGVLAISLLHSALASPQAEISGGRLPVLMTFNGNGDVLTSSVGLANAETMLPRDRALKALAGHDRSLAFTALTQSGTMRVFSVVPIIPETLYTLGSWPAGSETGLWIRALPSFALPSLMWLACLIVTWFAAEHLMTRHIRSLRRAITSFAKGSRAVDTLDISTAPREIRELAEAFARMTDTILHDEAELEDMVHQKEVLLREVHHRVKNNLQLIASIMNMQMRQARTPEAKGLMKGLQDRVMSLATIHRGLYQTTGLTDIRADELLSDIVRQVVNLATGPGRRISVHTDFGDIRLTPDQAVPLALLMTEALTNVMKYAGAPQGMVPRLDVSLTRDGATMAVLEVSNTVGTQPPSAETLAMGTGLGAQLLAGFAQQIGGEVRIEETETLHILRVRFEIRPLADAEARNEAAQALADTPEAAAASA
ncbi:sensor histidine kinase [Cereibacter sphaeroides]|uniref:sensor histidine kinase n=1 Tax=Cereibacter sphaeroides TaxID=1063 RepID=UPI001F2F7786|nr:sensor histidine kinase [Cereibacter sphaeroides]MCE6960987.1 sensor histidine kinase [Cereibacter sphaeroides]MCE6969715.1 sensor histidine kinase [Cereibacter sphaeroides]MCE6975190.1 sensor histidine kinase [Cereibacter sphaeroides]